MSDKRLFVFAGPNASGKSTIIQNFLDKGLCPGYYICPDQLVSPDKKNSVDEYLAAMRKAEQLRIRALEDEIPLTFETVLSTESKLEFIRLAKSKAYHITVIYIVTSDYHINLNRVKERVRRGGHDVPPDKVISRYEKCMNLMPDVIVESNIAKVFDNSSSIPVQVLEKTENGDLLLLNREQRHSWTEQYIVQKSDAKGIHISRDLSCGETLEWINGN